MGGRRVFVSGVGSELGTLVAGMLEAEPWVGSLAGIDADPPRRRLPNTTFHRIPPDQHDRIVDTITRFNPHVLVHIGVWEPDARASPTVARTLTDQAATSMIGAAAECPALEHVVVRSGIEIYGRGRDSLDPSRRDRPDPSHVGMGSDRRRDRTHRGPCLAPVSACRSVPCASRPCSARTCRRRSDACCAYRSCRSACSPIRRSP